MGSVYVISMTTSNVKGKCIADLAESNGAIIFAHSLKYSQKAE